MIIIIIKDDMQRYSRQREVVYDVLRTTKSHPTADMIYDEAKKVLPSISIATVYRNLREMAAEGKVRAVLTPDAKEHFDADLSAHAHFVCCSCGCVKDVAFCGNPELAEEGFAADRCDVVFSGLCKNCLDKEEF